MKIRQVGDRQTDIENLTDAFCNFANAIKIKPILIKQ